LAIHCLCDGIDCLLLGFDPCPAEPDDKVWKA
jgi:hypothetical protein